MPDDWQQHRDLMTSLYKNMTCGEVREYMKRKHNFSKSVRSYRSHWKRWGVRKYQKHAKATSRSGTVSPYGESLSPNTRATSSPSNSVMDTDESHSPFVADGHASLPSPIPLDTGNFPPYFGAAAAAAGPSPAYSSPAGFQFLLQPSNTLIHEYSYYSPPTECDFSLPLSPSIDEQIPSSSPLQEPWSHLQSGGDSHTEAVPFPNFGDSPLPIQAAHDPYIKLPQLRLTPADAPAQESLHYDIHIPDPSPESGPTYYLGSDNARFSRSGDKRQ